MNIVLACWGSKVFQKFTEKLYTHSGHKVVGIVNSFIDAEIKHLANQQNTPIWCWEQQFLNERDEIIEYISTDSIELNILNSLDQAIAHRLYLRTIYSDASQYLFMPTLRYYISKSKQFLCKVKANAILTPEIPHAYGDFVISSVAKAIGVPTYCLRPIQLNGRLISRVVKMNEEYDNIKLKYLNSLGKDILNSELSRIYDAAIDTKISLYSNKHSMAHKNAQLIASAQAKAQPNTSTIITSHIADTKRRLLNLSKTKIKQKAFILFLHLEPEANICPSSGKYFDQLSFISIANQICLKLGVAMYVREHPDVLKLPASDLEACKHLYTKHLNSRPIEFYKAIEKMSSFGGYMQSCSVTHIMKNTKTLGIISMSGSCMLQAAANGKIGITATNNYYRDLDHIFQIDEFNKILSNRTMTLEVIESMNKISPSKKDFQEAISNCTFVSRTLRNEEYSDQEAEGLIQALDKELISWN